MTLRDIVDDYHAWLPIKVARCRPENKLWIPSQLILKMGHAKYVSKFAGWYIHDSKQLAGFTREQVIAAFAVHALTIYKMNLKRGLYKKESK